MISVQLMTTGTWHPHDPPHAASRTESHEVRIPPLGLAGILNVPSNANSLVVFVHGSGSSRLSPRNNAVARALNDRGIATLLFDLLKPEEEDDRSKVFDISLLSGRLIDVLHWLKNKNAVGELPVGLFGASTGAAAALVAAARLGEHISAVVSRGGRPDLAGDALSKVRSPVLLLVGGRDFGVIQLNEDALARLSCPKLLRVITGATHLFEEPGTLEQVMTSAAHWFEKYMDAAPRAA
jgi:pimeloyl-ACP methyl ester carboxylesterase